MENVHTATARPAAHVLDADVERLRRALVAKRDALIAIGRRRSKEQRGVHDAETELADDAEHWIEQEAALRLGAFDRALLTDVNRALAKLEDGRYGQYGISEDSGAPIPLERLEALPWARRTAEEEERRNRAR